MSQLIRRSLGLGLALLLGASAIGVATSEDRYTKARLEMVEKQIKRRGVNDEKVLAAMSLVPRHEFARDAWRPEAYDDKPLEIEHEQTISQPYIVAFMTQLLELKGGEKVLEIGTGSGYHSAVLSRIAKRVYSMEIIPPLAHKAQRTLRRLGYLNVDVRIGDGYKGWPEQAPFDAILLSAAPPVVPEPLIEQLRIGGKMVVPVGSPGLQDLLVITRTATGHERQKMEPVRMVPMTGEVQQVGKPPKKPPATKPSPVPP